MPPSASTSHPSGVSRRRGRPAANEPSGDQLRELVIQAAMQVYAENGYSRSSVEQILQTAQVSRPTFYRLFANKRAVIEELVSRVVADFAETLPPALMDTNTIEQAIDAALNAYFDWGRRWGAVVGMGYREVHDPESPTNPMRARIFELLMRVLSLRAQTLGYSHFSPLLIDTLLHVVEYLGMVCFIPGQPSEDAVQRSHKVARRIVFAALLHGVQDDVIPPLSSI